MTISQIVDDWFTSYTAVGRFVAPTLLSIFIAVVTAVVTVRLSLDRFRSERWWERKTESYASIIEHLYNAKAYLDAMGPVFRGDVHILKERREELGENYGKAYRQLERERAIGAFIVSKEAIAVLEKLAADTAFEDGPFEDIWEPHSKAYEDALETMRDIAKKDLGVD